MCAIQPGRVGTAFVPTREHQFYFNAFMLTDNRVGTKAVPTLPGLQRTVWKMNKRIRVIFLSVCATVVSVAIWTIAIVLNVLRVVLGESNNTTTVAWTITVISTAVFFGIFYRHFSRTER